jgi:hypothetical protein
MRTQEQRERQAQDAQAYGRMFECQQEEDGLGVNDKRWKLVGSPENREKLVSARSEASDWCHSIGTAE